MTDPVTAELPPEAQIQAARRTMEAGWNRLCDLAKHVELNWMDSHPPYTVVAFKMQLKGRRIVITGATATEAIWAAIELAEKR